jgi:hypothetical protein
LNEEFEDEAFVVLFDRTLQFVLEALLLALPVAFESDPPWLVPLLEEFPVVELLVSLV